MSGYDHYSKSNNALQAEEDERFPLSIAQKILAKKLKWSQAKAKAFLEFKGTNEWHHTSCKYNTTNYYDVSDDFIEDNQDELVTFQFSASKKEVKMYFKCWNIDSANPSNWDYSFTKREGNYTYSYNTIRSKLDKEYNLWETKIKELSHTHIKTKEKYQQQIVIIQKIIGLVNKNMSDKDKKIKLSLYNLSENITNVDFDLNDFESDIERKWCDDVI